jgi:putative ABC transport system ATP-binding protein
MDQISISHVKKIYYSGDVETVALDDISFSIKKGEFVAIVGPSGSGKSTLMHILGALDTPTSGTYILDGQDVSKLSKDQLADIRNKKIGFVFQAFNLLPRTTAIKNVALPMTYAGIHKDERLKRAEELLKEVGLGDRMNHTSSQLSGGQMQRVAIARALSMNPAIILADEPTGNISTVQAEEIMKIFQSLQKQGHTIIIITHESSIAAYSQRTIYIKDGKIERETKNGKA